MAEQLIIIGGSAAGMSAAAKARRLNNNLQITVFQKSGYVSYGACGFPHFIRGEVTDINQLIARTPEQFAAQQITVHTGHQVETINPYRHTVDVTNLRTGETFSAPWDKLIIAGGANAAHPPIPGAHLKGIFTLRTVEDALAIRQWLAEENPRRGVVIGGGYIGLELAESLSARGLSVTVIEKLPVLMPSFDADMSTHFLAELDRQGVQTRLGETVSAFESDAPLGEIVERITAKLEAQNIHVKPEEALEALDGYRRVREVIAGGTRYPAEIVLLCAGIKPNVSLAQQAGIEIGPTGAIAVDPYQQTNLANIWAAGDVAECRHLLTGKPLYLPLGTLANKQGRVAGANAAGDNVKFGGVLGTGAMKLFDLHAARTGLTEWQAKNEGFNPQSVTISAGNHAHYLPGYAPIHVKLIYRQGSQRLLGAQMIGRDVAKRIDVIATALRAGLTTYDLAELDLSYAPPFAPVWDPVLVAANAAGK